jgi:hypothetical protein
VSELADYCRQVEAHLTRVNGGHMVRVVGAGFALVKQWADEGIPLSVVFKGIEQKAQRHQLGASRRPLRIEFCEPDVRELFDAWRRAVGVTEPAGDRDAHDGGRDFSPGDVAGPEGPASLETPAKRRPASKAIDKAIDRLGRLAGRLELPDEFREAVSHAIERLSAVREGLAHSRGAAREPWLEQLGSIDQGLLTHARGLVDAAVMRGLIEQAETDMAPYRERLAPEAWDRAVTLTVDRGVRAHLGLPSLEV